MNETEDSELNEEGDKGGEGSQEEDISEETSGERKESGAPGQSLRP